MQLAQDHPVVLALIVLTIVAAFVGAFYLKVVKARRLAECERNIAVTDSMTGTEFEHFIARLMRRSGFRRVAVSGKSGDMGCDVVGYAPDGRKVVVQCKRYSSKLTSPDVQWFAGTARDIHRADVPLLVTTAHVTNPARDVAKLCNITLVDRTLLSQWATTHTPPIKGWPSRKRHQSDPQVTAVAPPPTAAVHAGDPAVASAAPPPATSPLTAPPSRAPAADWWSDHPPLEHHRHRLAATAACSPTPPEVSHAFTAEISRTNPSCFVFRLDQSHSMIDTVGDAEIHQRKADVVADALNRLLTGRLLHLRASSGRFASRASMAQGARPDRERAHPGRFSPDRNQSIPPRDRV
ncbi:restriction endonuclease [Micromonospora sp. NPDC005324]|uniref:restriction endonuclease n=1 Tax=Micromonospora sp. NPDC005324 TaxID=3157033 RepID=UPI0033A4A5CC